MTHEQTIEHLKANPRLAEQTAKLMAAVGRIPHFCGRADCTHYGCIEVREARECCLRIINYHK